MFKAFKHKVATIKNLGFRGLWISIKAWGLFVYYAFTKTNKVSAILKHYKQNKHSPNKHKMHRSTNRIDKHFYQDIDTAKFIYQCVILASKYHIFNPNCLLRCLVVQRLLLNECIDCNISFGVKINPQQATSKLDKLAGHCWLSVGDSTITDSKNIQNEYQNLDHFNRLK